MPVDTGKPGVTVTPVAATSPVLENPGLSAAMAIDGKMTTRWSSAAEDGAWIQFDFGARTQIGYMKLPWENSYGKPRAWRTTTWSQLRYVSNGQGGSEEFFNSALTSPPASPATSTTAAASRQAR